MPIILTIDHQRHEVKAVCVGPIRLSDSMAHLEREAREHGLSYRKLMDTRGSGFEISEDETRTVAHTLRELSKKNAIGPAAVVVSSEAIFEMTQMITRLTEDCCQIRAFRDEKEAREWLASQPI
jgi:hypothetical protein